MAPERLDIGHEVLRRIVGQIAVWGRAPAAALVEDDDAVEARVEEAAVRRRSARTRAAMQEQHRLAARIAGLLPMHDMAVIERQPATGKRLDLREQITAVVADVHGFRFGFLRDRAI